MTENRRNYFRIKNRAHVEYQELNPDKNSEQQVTDQYCSYLHLMNELYTLDLETSRLLTQLSDNDRTSAALFKIISKKIELISRTLVLMESKLPEDEFQTVDISEGGMAFYAAEALPIGQLLYLKLVVIPDYFLLMPEAVVVTSSTQADIAAPQQLPFWTRVNFTRIDECQKQWLARHIVKVQQQQRRDSMD